MRRRLAWLLVAAAVAFGGAGAAAPAGPSSHVVQPGQTLGMIARRYNISIEALCAANGTIRRSPIKPGQRLALPGKRPPAAPEAGRTGPPAGRPGEPRASAPAPQPSTPAPRAERAGPTAPRAASGPRAAAPGAATARGQASAAKGNAGEDVGYARRPRKRGWVELSSLTGEYRGYLFDRKGRLTAAARKAMPRVMASWRTGSEAAIDPRLLQLLVRVSDHFGGRQLRVVSGFRPWSPRQYTPHSRHNLGRAVDFSVVGVPNKVVRDFCRTLGPVGVGYYPNSSFVHLDVRDRGAYWVDFGGPGERPRYATAEGRDPGSLPRRAVAPASDEHEGEGDDDGSEAPATAAPPPEPPASEPPASEPPTDGPAAEGPRDAD